MVLISAHCLCLSVASNLDTIYPCITEIWAVNHSVLSNVKMGIAGCAGPPLDQPLQGQLYYPTNDVVAAIYQIDKL